MVFVTQYRNTKTIGTIIMYTAWLNILNYLKRNLKLAVIETADRSGNLEILVLKFEIS